MANVQSPSSLNHQSTMRDLLTFMRDIFVHRFSIVFKTLRMRCCHSASAKQPVSS